MWEVKRGPELLVAAGHVLLACDALGDGPAQPQIEGAEVAQEGEGQQKDTVADFSDPVEIEGDSDQGHHGGHEQARKIDEGGSPDAGAAWRAFRGIGGLG